MAPKAKKGAGTKAKGSSRRQASKGTKNTPKIKKGDPLAEYQALMKTTGVNVTSLDAPDCLANVPGHFSTGSLGVDLMMNGLGIPWGRVTEVYGDPYLGKSTFLDHIFASAQKIGGVVVLAEPEGGRDKHYTQRLGVDPAQLQYLLFKREELHLEGILQSIYNTADFWRNNYPEIPVIYGFDALGGTSTKGESVNRLAASNQPGAAAKVMREAGRLIPALLGNTNMAVVICNHQYTTFNSYGSNRASYGGKGLSHLATLRLGLSWGGQLLGPGKRLMGHILNAKLVKNKLGNAPREMKIAMVTGQGINNVWNIHNSLGEYGIRVKDGSWSTIDMDGEIIKYQNWAGLFKKCEEDPGLGPRLMSVLKDAYLEREHASVRI